MGATLTRGGLVVVNFVCHPGQGTWSNLSLDVAAKVFVR